MAAHSEYKAYIKSVWDLIQPSTRRSGIMTDAEIGVKIDEAKKTVVQIIKDMEMSQQEEAQFVTVPGQNGSPLPIQSTAISSTNGEEDEQKDQYAEDDSDNESDDTENRNAPPPKGVRIVGIRKPVYKLYCPLVAAEKKKPNEGRKIKFYWDDDHPEDFYDDFDEYRKSQEKEKKDNLRHLYRLLFWLDFLSSGYNSNRQHFRHF